VQNDIYEGKKNKIIKIKTQNTPFITSLAPKANHMSPSIVSKNYVFVSSFIINVVRALELCLYGALRFKGFAK
jgi:hypothetical protein